MPAGLEIDEGVASEGLFWIVLALVSACMALIGKSPIRSA